MYGKRRRSYRRRGRVGMMRRSTYRPRRSRRMRMRRVRPIRIGFRRA